LFNLGVSYRSQKDIGPAHNSVDTLSNKNMESYEALVEKHKPFITGAAAKNELHFEADLWDSHHNSYIGLVANAWNEVWENETWTLKNLYLGCYSFDNVLNWGTGHETIHSHTGENIAESLGFIGGQWGIRDYLLSDKSKITRDSGLISKKVWKNEVGHLVSFI
jgi:hypothetical protein